VGRARQGLRQLMATPIQFTPFIDEQGFREIRFEGRWGLEGMFDGVVTKVASPTGFEPAEGKIGARSAFAVEEGRRLAQRGV